MPLFPSSKGRILTTTTIAMPRLTAFLLLWLLLFHSFSGDAESIEVVVRPPAYLSHKVNMRKLMVEIALLDYDYGGPNTRHEPKKGKPGGGKNR